MKAFLDDLSKELPGLELSFEVLIQGEPRPYDWITESQWDAQDDAKLVAMDGATKPRRYVVLRLPFELIASGEKVAIDYAAAMVKQTFK